MNNDQLHRSFAAKAAAQDDNARGLLGTNMFEIRQLADGVSFGVRVHPRAKKNAVTGVLGDALKVSLTTPPIEGRANEACIEFFAKLLKVPRSSVTIASGQTSRNKVLRITGLTADELRKRLEQ